MASYEDILAQLQPSDMDRRDVLTQSLLAAAAGALRGGPNTGTVLSNTMFAGMAGYNNAVDRARAQRIDDFKARKLAADLAAQEQAAQEQAKRLGLYNEALSGAPAGGGPPSPQSNARDRYMQAAETAMRMGDAQGAERFVKMAQALDEEFSPEPRYDQQGRAFLTNKRGGMKYLDGIQARDKIVSDNLGDVQAYRTEYSPNPIDAVRRGQSPDSVASNNIALRGQAVTMRGQDMTDARAKESLEYQRTNPNLPGSVIEKLAQNNVTLSKIEKALGEVERKPDSFGAFNYLPDAVRQRTDPQGVQGRSLVADIAGQRIHDRSGAAVTVGEAERLRPYIPNATDEPAAIKTKLVNLQNEYQQMQAELAQGKSIIEAARGGNRATGQVGRPAAPAAPPRAGTVEDGYVFRGGNPADPKNWSPVR